MNSQYIENYDTIYCILNREIYIRDMQFNISYFSVLKKNLLNGKNITHYISNELFFYALSYFIFGKICNTEKNPVYILY